MSVRFLDLDFESEIQSSEPFHPRWGDIQPSEALDAAAAIKTIALDEGKPIPALPAFHYPEANSLYFKLNFADNGASFVSVSLTYNRRAIPGEDVHVQVKLFSSVLYPSRRIASISLRITVPGNQVNNVEPRVWLGTWGQVNVTETETSQVTLDVTGTLKPFLDASAENKQKKSIKRSATETSRQEIHGAVEGKDAFWSITEASGLCDEKGIRGSMDLRFTLKGQPRTFLYELNVVEVVDGKMVPHYSRRAFLSRFW